MASQGISRIDLVQNDILLKYGDDVEYLYLLIKGKIKAYTTYGNYVLSPGTILALTGSNFGISTYTYVAMEDCIVQAFPCREAGDVIKICETYSNDFPRFVASNHRFIGELVRTYLTLLMNCKKSNPDFVLDERINRWELDKYNALNSVDNAQSAAYYKLHPSIATAELVESSRFANVLNDACLTMADLTGINMDYVPPPPAPIVEEVLTLEDTDIFSEEGYSSEEILRELAGSLDQILSFSGWETETREAFRQDIIKLRSLKDKLAPDDESRALRARIKNNFYDLYYRVFKNSLSGEAAPHAVTLFLNFGYIDEYLIDPRNTVTLYRYAMEVEELCNSSNIHTMYSWLKKILWGEKEPSKNGFDQTYEEFIHLEFREGHMTGSLPQMLNNQEQKLLFEIDNLFKQTHYMAHGRVSSFMPILIEDHFTKPVDKMLVQVSNLNEIVQMIRKTDYSLFYRSRVYSNNDLKIGKEFVYSEVLPDFILTPVIGSNAVMWQEIEGRNRLSASRMVFPIMTNGDLNKMVINVFGKYRWEICKRIQGAYWNNISEPSLTSEYCDYLQFYKKNRDLTDDMKSKIHSQLAACRTNYAEYFAKDYEYWIMYESKGSGRLNKIARRIISKYIPFNMTIRNELRANPMFKDVIEYAERQNSNKRHHMDNIIQALVAKGVEPPREIRDTRTFFAQ